MTTDFVVKIDTVVLIQLLTCGGHKFGLLSAPSQIIQLKSNYNKFKLKKFLCQL